MTGEERARLRLAVSERRRAELGVVVCPRGYGTPTGYTRGCRCRLCTQAATAERAARARRQRARTDERRVAL